MVYTKMVIVDLNKFIKFVQHSYCSDIHKHSEAWIDVFQFEGYKSACYNSTGDSVMLSDTNYFLFAIKWS